MLRQQSEFLAVVYFEISLLRRQHRGLGTPYCAPIFVKKRDDWDASRVKSH
jgi:hypothetical protein